MVENFKFDKESHDSVAESTLSKLQREGELIRDGMASGIMQRLSHPQELIPAAVTAFVGSGVINLAMRAGGPWASGAKLAAGGCTVLMGYDLAITRGVPTMSAALDTWKSADHLRVNETIVANYAGTALVDYTTMAASGFAGVKASNALVTRFLPASAHPAYLTPSSELLEKLNKASAEAKRAMSISNTNEANTSESAWNRTPGPWLPGTGNRSDRIR